MLRLSFKLVFTYFTKVESLVGDVLYSIAGAVYDLMGYVHPLMTAAHNGMLFSTLLYDNDLIGTFECVQVFGGSWWHIQCALWCPTTVNPLWFVIGDDSWRSMESARMMVKLQ